MIWKGHGMYAQSDKGYRVSKSFIAIDVPKYVAYGPNKKMLNAPSFYNFKDARECCEKHYDEVNKQTEGDMF